MQPSTLPPLPAVSNFTAKSYDKFLQYGEWNVHLAELNSMENAILQNLKADMTAVSAIQTAISSLKSSPPTGVAGGDLTGNFPNPTIKGSVALSGSPTTTTQSAGDNSTKIATDAFVTTAINNAIAGVNPAVAVSFATTAASDTSAYTYNNGVSGVGATLTGSNNVAFAADGQTATALLQRVLVKNDTQSPSGAFNGIYYVSQLQTAILPPILTRALDYNQPSDINNTGAIPVVNGTANAQTSWLLTSTINTVGTDALTFIQFSLKPSTIVTTTRTISTTAPLTGGGDLSANRTFAISNATATTAGSVPTPPNNTTTFFRGDATFTQVGPSGISSGTSGQVMLNNATPTPTWTTLSGAITVDSTGATTLGSVTPSAITFLANKSATKTPGATGNWSSGSATISLTAGTWIVYGACFAYQSAGGTNPISGVSYVFSTADGANSNVEPSVFNTGGTRTLQTGQPDPQSIFTSTGLGLALGLSSAAAFGYMANCYPIIVSVSATNSIYLVPFVTTSNAANTRIVTDIWALKVSTATS